MNHYTFRAQWCPEYDGYVGRCLELPFLWERASTAPEAVARVVEAVDRHVDDVLADGGEAPSSLTEHNYTGTFVVRTSREMHARLAIEAVEQRVSMNQWVAQQLAGRPAVGGLGIFPFD